MPIHSQDDYRLQLQRRDLSEYREPNREVQQTLLPLARAEPDGSFSPLWILYGRHCAAVEDKLALIGLPLPAGRPHSLYFSKCRVQVQAKRAIQSGWRKSDGPADLEGS